MICTAHWNLSRSTQTTRKKRERSSSSGCAEYNLPELEEQIDVPSTKRGIFRLTEKRNDLKALELDESVVLVPMDPGCVKPLQGAYIPYSECSSAETICNYFNSHSDAMWNITAQEWKDGSGRSGMEKHESGIRSRDPLYNSAIEKLRETRKKCASTSTFLEHCKVAFKHLNILSSKLVTIDKSKLKWVQTRRTISWLSRQTNKIFKIGKENRTKEDRKKKFVAFFGDGTFKHQKKYAPVPKKLLAKQLATKGLTIVLDEFNTSKNCPCGSSELEDVPSSQAAEGNRLRRHKTFGQDGICCVECSLGKENMDRDVLAVINFTLCAGAALGGEERPKHLCRACSAF